MAKFIPNPAGIAKLRSSPSEPVYRDLYRRTLRVAGAAKALCPVDTGRLRASIRFAVVSTPLGAVGYVGTDVKYAPFVHGGTKPHDIVPNRAQALYWKGATHPVGRVHHPGTAAHPFLRDALAAAGSI